MAARNNYNDIRKACRAVRDLAHTPHCVLVYLAEWAQKDGRGIYPTIELIAENTMLSTRTVKRALAILVEQEYLLPDGMHYHTKQYRLNMEKLGLAGVDLDARTKKKPAQEEPPPGDTGELPASTQPSKGRPMDIDSRIERKRQQIANEQERYDSARAVGNMAKANAIGLKLDGFKYEMKYLLQEKRAKEMIT